MKFKNTLFVSLLLLIFLTIGAANAFEYNSTCEDISFEQNDETTINEIPISDNDNDKLIYNDNNSEINTIETDFNDIDYLSLNNETTILKSNKFIDDQEFINSNNKKVNYGTLYINSYILNVKLLINGTTKSYNVGKTTDGLYYTTIELPNKPGTYPCKAIYSGKTYDFKITIKYDSLLKVETQKFNVGEQASIAISLITYPSVPRGTIGNVIVYIDGVKYVLTKDNFKYGVYTLNTTFSKIGKYPCSAQLYIADDYYTSIEQFFIEVYDTPKIIYYTQEYKNTLGESVNINIDVVDYLGYPISKGKIYLDSQSFDLMYTPVQFTLNPKSVGSKTYSISYVPQKGSYYKSYYDYYAITVTTVSPTYITTKPSYGEVGYYVFPEEEIVKDKLGNILTVYAGEVEYYFNGKKINYHNGLLPPQKPGVYTYKVVYKPSSSSYLSSYSYFKVIYKYKVKIKVKNINGKQGKKIKIIAITKDKNTGKVIKKGRITFKINGKKYLRSIKKGKAILKIKCPKAYYWKTTTSSYYDYYYEIKHYRTVYKCTCTFNENKKYSTKIKGFKIISEKNSKIKKHKIKHKKTKKSKTSKKSLEADIITKKDEYTFWFNYEGHVLGAMPVKYKIYTGSSYEEYDSQTNSLGFVSIYNIPKGIHKIYIEGHYLLSTKTYHSTFTIYRI